MTRCTPTHATIAYKLLYLAILLDRLCSLLTEKEVKRRKKNKKEEDKGKKKKTTSLLLIDNFIPRLCFMHTTAHVLVN